jgi:lysine-N-methylase
LRFACPSAADNRGRPVTVHATDLKSYGSDLEEREGVRDRPSAPPPLQSGQRLSWADLERFADAVLTILDRVDRPLEYRLRQCLALSAMCRQAKFEAVTGARLREFLELMVQGLDGEVETDPLKLGPPGWVGRMLFRQALAIYSRRDTGPRRGVSRHGRVALLRAAWRFARGTGEVPRVHGLLPAVTFEQLEQPVGSLTKPAEQILERYYRVKVSSFQFFGPTNFNAPLWDGLASLLLTYPATLWLSRAFADRPRDQAVSLALRIVDDNFGYNRLLGSQRQQWGARILAARGELAKLIGWYSR